MKRPAIICVMVFCLFMACDGGAGNGERAAIEETIRGYISSYNASNYEECLTYFADYGDREDALSALAFLRNQTGELTLVDFYPEAIAIVEGSMAKVPVEFIIMGERSSQWIHLKKETGNWKILWEQ